MAKPPEQNLPDAGKDFKPGLGGLSPQAARILGMELEKSMNDPSGPGRSGVEKKLHKEFETPDLITLAREAPKVVSKVAIEELTKRKAIIPSDEFFPRLGHKRTPVGILGKEFDIKITDREDAWTDGYLLLSDLPSEVVREWSSMSAKKAEIHEEITLLGHLVTHM